MTFAHHSRYAFSPTVIALVTPQGCAEYGMVEFLLHDILHAPWLGEANVRAAVR